MIKFGVVIPQGRLADLPTSMNNVEKYESLIKFIKKIEDLGFYSGWMFDHLHPISNAPKKQPVFECWTTLTALSQHIKNLRLGQIVTCNSFRFPSLLAKMSACFDVISNGRLEFGIGAGWLEEEYNAYGIPFPKNKRRIGQLEEAVQILIKMWTEEKTYFKGRYYKIEGAINEPKPVQKPYPPILIGGRGEKYTLKIVTKYGDRCNFGGTPEEYQHKLNVLKQHCINQGRDYDKIEKTWHMSPANQPSGRLIIGEDEEELRRMLEKCWLLERSSGESLDQFISRTKKNRMVGVSEDIIKKIEEYVRLDVTYFILYFNYALSMDLKPLEIFAKEVMPQFKK